MSVSPELTLKSRSEHKNLFLSEEELSDMEGKASGNANSRRNVLTTLFVLDEQETESAAHRGGVGNPDRDIIYNRRQGPGARMQPFCSVSPSLKRSAVRKARIPACRKLSDSPVRADKVNHHYSTPASGHNATAVERRLSAGHTGFADAMVAVVITKPLTIIPTPYLIILEPVTILG